MNKAVRHIFGILAICNGALLSSCEKEYTTDPSYKVASDSATEPYLISENKLAVSSPRFDNIENKEIRSGTRYDFVKQLGNGNKFSLATRLIAGGDDAFTAKLEEESKNGILLLPTDPQLKKILALHLQEIMGLEDLRDLMNSGERSILRSQYNVDTDKELLRDIDLVNILSLKSEEELWTVLDRDDYTQLMKHFSFSGTRQLQPGSDVSSDAGVRYQVKQGSHEQLILTTTGRTEFFLNGSVAHTGNGSVYSISSIR